MHAALCRVDTVANHEECGAGDSERQEGPQGDDECAPVLCGRVLQAVESWQVQVCDIADMQATASLANRLLAEKTDMLIDRVQVCVRARACVSAIRLLVLLC